MGPHIDVEAPIIRTVVGTIPKTLGDLEEILNYVNQQLVHALSSTHTGQEGSFIDFESKALHISMIDNLAKEVADIAQIAGFDFPRGDPDAALNHRLHRALPSCERRDDRLYRGTGSI
jgi:acetyl-CoA decarbonylase/synthase complex subunit alpha